MQCSPLVRPVLAATLLTALLACGGGGGGSSPTEPGPPPPAPPPNVTQNLVTVEGASACGQILARGTQVQVTIRYEALQAAGIHSNLLFFNGQTWEIAPSNNSLGQIAAGTGTVTVNSTARVGFPALTTGRIRAFMGTGNGSGDDLATTGPDRDFVCDIQWQ